MSSRTVLGRGARIQVLVGYKIDIPEEDLGGYIPLVLTSLPQSCDCSVVIMLYVRKSYANTVGL